MNPVYQRFFAGKGCLSSKFNIAPELYLLKKQLLAERYATETLVTSSPFFVAKGRYLEMHSVCLRNQSAVHRTPHARSAAASAKLAASVAPLFNRLTHAALAASRPEHSGE